MTSTECSAGLAPAQQKQLEVTFSQPWGEVFGDQVVATAILDRLLHHSHVLTVRGDSYRLREKRRSGLIKSSSAVRTIPATGEEGSP